MKRLIYDIIVTILLSAIFLMTVYALISPDPIAPQPEIKRQEPVKSWEDRYWDRLHKEIDQHVERELNGK